MKKLAIVVLASLLVLTAVQIPAGSVGRVLTEALRGPSVGTRH